MNNDVRAVANAVLDVAAADGCGVTNLALNKIIYFLHAGYLHEWGEPLVSAKIEAWDHGPVFREIYHQFKKFGRYPIEGRAMRLDPVSGDFKEVLISLTPRELTYVRVHGTELLKIPAGRLVSMSHVPDGPWHNARFGTGIVNPGIEITDDLIKRCATTQVRH